MLRSPILGRWRLSLRLAEFSNNVLLTRHLVVGHHPFEESGVIDGILAVHILVSVCCSSSTFLCLCKRNLVLLLRQTLTNCLHHCLEGLKIDELPAPIIEHLEGGLHILDGLLSCLDIAPHLLDRFAISLGILCQRADL